MRIGLIGAGRIGGEIVRLATEGQLPLVTIDSVLVRAPRGDAAGIPHFTEAEAFFAREVDLVIEAAGPAALRIYAERALTRAELWSVSASAFADPQVEALVAAAERRTGNRLRLLAGAFGGLDMIAAAMAEGDARLLVTADLVGRPPDLPVAYDGPAREAVRRFEGINVVAALALAGPGWEATRVVYYPHLAGYRRRFSVAVDSRFGNYRASVDPAPKPGPSAVVASIIAALAQRAGIVRRAW